MRIAAIDIGTNTILLLIADVEAGGKVDVLRDEQVIARLGKGVDANRTILPETFERARVVLTTYKAMASEAAVDRVVACGTSFLRDARNQQDFVDFVRKRVGIEIRILTGDEEALLTYQGAILGLRSQTTGRHRAVLDIGGGSTELTVGLDDRVINRVSIDIGSVRLTERFLKSSPPSPAGLSDAAHFVRDSLSVVPPLPQSTLFVGVAGTLTTLAALDLRLQSYDRTKVSGHVLKRKSIEEIFEELKTRTVDHIRSYPQVLSGRADIILAGILILLEALEATNKEEITVSDCGLRYGIALSAFHST